MNNNSNRGPPSGPSQNGDQYALSLLVNAAEGRDSPRQRPTGSDPRFGDQSFSLRGLSTGGFGGTDASLEEQILLQQQSYGGGGSGAILNQLREQNLLSQLNQQQQLAALLGLGGGSGGGGGGGGGGSGSWNASSPEMRQALAAAQFRQNQAPPQFTQADILALSRSGALSGLFGGGGGSGGGAGAYGGSVSGVGAYGSSGAGAFLGSSGAADFAGSSFAAELEGLHRLEELNRRQRLLAASSEAPRPGVDRGLGSQGMTRELQQVSESPSRNEPNRKIKLEAARTPAKEANKDELEKTPGSVIVPCRARGMPMDHNFKTAYFVIPENVKHGEELICSYFACRNAGIKFRYCSHCKVPVAKRNFRKRHKHGGDIMVKGDDSAGEEDVAKKGIPSQITASREETAEADGISSQSADSSNRPDEKNKASYAVIEQGLVRNSVLNFETNKIKNKVQDEAPLNGKIDADRQARWLSLLTKRPSTKESDTMSGWLMEVLAVSDLETPLKPGETIDSEIPKADKKRSGLEDSTRSDIEYGSTDDSVTNEKSIDNDDMKDTLKSTNGGLAKKKRPADLLRDDPDEANNKSDSYVSGSFAEWKERKKQKKQSKGVVPGHPGVSQQESV